MTTRYNELSGKKALVLGASEGIGRAIASAFVQEEMEVSICSRSLSKLEITQKEICTHHTIVGDLTKPLSGISICKEAIKKMGHIDYLVINTGGPAKGTFEQVQRQQWEQDFNSLWMSVVEMLQTVLPMMKERRYGRVLMVTSIAAKKPLLGLTTSNGLRAGLEGLMRTLVLEYSSFGITFNCLLPGYTNTQRLQQLNLSNEQITKLVPNGKLADPSELGQLAVFLCTNFACSITGQSIAVDGGVNAL
ncbi:SDR family oxidoreductase [Bacteriovoracaceae bacterium]|nr:SDR family oxidoreductase [Bacteriovoracaceae bacterium]